MTKTLYASLAGLVSVLLIGFAGSAVAQDGYTPWRTMHAGANPPTTPAARQQCLNAGVSAGECSAFAAMLDQGQCRRTVVPDGTPYRWLGGRGGKVSHHKTKELGSATTALRCVLPSGRTLDWYFKSVTGAVACNNVGEVARQSTTTLSLTGQHSTIRRQEVVTTPGTLIDVGCPTCCDAETLYLPGTRAVIETQQSTGGGTPLKLK